MEKRNFCLEDMKNFLQEQVLHRQVAAVKQFDKGQLPVFYLKLQNATQSELTVKFYRSKKQAEAAHALSASLAKNPKLCVPKLSDSAKQCFKYGGFYGLVYEYIRGREAASAGITAKHMRQLCDKYTEFQKCRIDQPLRRFVSQNGCMTKLRRLLDEIKKQNLSLKMRSAVFLAEKFAEQISREYGKLKEPERKLVHDDVTKSNLLFEGNDFRAFLDTDSVCWGYVGKDFAEFILSNIRRYPFYKGRKKAVRTWYEIVDKTYHLSFDEYIYGLNVYYLYRLLNYFGRGRNNVSLLKLYNFWQFIKLHKTVVNELKKIKQIED